MLDEHISTTLYPQPHGAVFDCSPAWRSSYRLAKAKHTYTWPEEVSSYGCWILNITEEQTWPVQAPEGPESRNTAESKNSNGTLNTTETQATAIYRETARMRFTCAWTDFSPWTFTGVGPLTFGSFLWLACGVSTETSAPGHVGSQETFRSNLCRSMSLWHYQYILALCVLGVGFEGFVYNLRAESNSLGWVPICFQLAVFSLPKLLTSVPSRWKP